MRVLVLLMLFAGPAIAGELGTEELLQVAEAYLSQGQAEKALVPLNQVLARPQVKPALKARLHVLLGRVHAAGGRFPEAVKAYETALGLDPAVPEAHLLLGLTFDMLEDPERAAKAYEAGLKRRPKDATLLHQLGLTRLAQGKLMAACMQLAQAAELAPSAEVLGDYGYALATAGHAPAARKVLERALALAPEDAEVMVTLASVLPESESARAVTLVEQAAERGAPRALVLRGARALGHGELVRAERDFAEAARLAPEDPAAGVGLAEVRLAQGRHADAVKLASSLCTDTVTVRGACLAIGRAGIALKQWATARTALMRVVGAEGDRLPAWTLLLEVARGSGDAELTRKAEAALAH